MRITVCYIQLRGIGVQYFAENDYLGTADMFFVCYVFDACCIFIVDCRDGEYY